MNFKNKNFIEKEYLIYFLISICFIVLNFATLHNLLPWCDEVMFIDTPANYILHGSWSTTAWYKSDDISSFSVYPPLYQLIEVCWLSAWGGDISIYSVRSLNIFIVLIIGYLMLSFTKKELLKVQSLNFMSIAIFTILLWGTKEFGWMYRNGRVDILGLLFSLLTMRSVWNNIKYNHRSDLFQSSIFAGLAFLSGIQNAVFLVTVLLFIILFFKAERKKIYKATVSMVIGMIIGCLICLTFFFHMGYLKSFIANIVGMSATMQQVFETIRPYLVGPLHLKPAAERNVVQMTGNAPDFFSKLLDSFTYISYVVLLAINIIILYIHRKAIRPPRMRNAVVILVVFSVFVIFFMNLAGRFVSYYRWMAYLPMVMSVLIVLNQGNTFHKNKYALYGVATMALMTLGIHSFTNKNTVLGKVDDINLDEFHEMMQAANIPQDSHVAGPFFSFYELKNNYTHCYFPQVYPTEFITQLDYLVVYGEERYKDGFPLYRQADVINYLYELQMRTDIKLELIKEDKKNDIRLYRIQSVS